MVPPHCHAHAVLPPCHLPPVLLRLRPAAHCGCTLRVVGRLQLRFGKTLRTVDKSATKGKGFSASDVSYLKVPVNGVTHPA